MSHLRSGRSSLACSDFGACSLKKGGGMNPAGGLQGVGGFCPAPSHLGRWLPSWESLAQPALLAQGRSRWWRSVWQVLLVILKCGSVLSGSEVSFQPQKEPGQPLARSKPNLPTGHRATDRQQSWGAAGRGEPPEVTHRWGEAPLRPSRPGPRQAWSVPAFIL